MEEADFPRAFAQERSAPLLWPTHSLTNYPYKRFLQTILTNDPYKLTLQTNLTNDSYKLTFQTNLTN